MKKVITSGIVTAVATLSMAAPAFAATTYQPIHASSTLKMHAATTSLTTIPKTTTKAKAVLLIGSVTQTTAEVLTVAVKTKSYTVTLGPAVLIYNKAGKNITFGSIKTGDQIRVRGMATGTQVTATSMRDLSL